MKGNTDISDSQFKYWAFISYSSMDQNWGQWMIKSIEHYRVPKSLVGLKTNCGAIPSRIYPVFRDRDELRAGEDVHEELKHALDQSRYLVVICSPNSANPDSWVNTEITDFKAMGRERDVIALIVQGEPFASNRRGSEDKECFPAALRYKVDSQGRLTNEPAEPLAADVTREDQKPRSSRRKALLKIIARMIDVDFDTLEQRDRRRRRQRTATWSAIGLSLFIVFSWLAAQWVQATQVSTSQQLAKQSKETQTTDKDLSALLAVNAYHMYPTPAAYDALLTTVSENPNLITFLRRGVRVSDIAISADNALVAVADCPNPKCEYQEIHVYDVKTRQHAFKPIRLDVKGIGKIRFQGRRLFVVAQNDDTYQLLALDVDQPTSQPTMLYRVNRPIANIAASDDGRFYAVATDDGEYKVFDKNLGGRKCGGIVNNGKIEAKLAFSADNTHFAVSNESMHRILIVDLTSCQTSVLSPVDRLAAMSFVSNGEYLATIMPDGTIDEWSVAEHKRLERYSEAIYTLNGFIHEFSPGAILLASKNDNQIRVYDLAKRRNIIARLKDESLPGYAVDQLRNDMHQLLLVKLQGHQGSPRLFHFSQDASLLVSVDDKQVVILWSIKGMPLYENQGQGSPYVNSDNSQTKATSADGRFYATIREETEGCIGDYTWDCTRWLKLTLYDTQTNLQIKTLERIEHGLPGTEPPWIKFAQDGAVIIGQGTSQQTWHVDLPYLLNQACRIANRSLTKAEIEIYLGWRRWFL